MTSILTFEDVLEIFQAVDIDFSGYITAAEVRHVMTNLRICEDDSTVDEMITRYDVDGNCKITPDEFLQILKDMGYDLEDDAIQISKQTLQRPKTEKMEKKVNDTASVDKVLRIDTLPQDAQQFLTQFDFNSTGHVCLSDMSRAAELLRVEKESKNKDPEANPALHWKPGREKRGLGSLIYKANHIALIVSDVGRSARFYSEIMGFQQIRRPNFDKHGAWFTMGNLELHLIKGTPVVHDGEDLIVGHISIETFQIDKVPGLLRMLGVPFRQNVSVPSKQDAGTEGTNSSNTSSNIVKQYFIRDPDGYYLEICNCDVLVKYCLGDESELQEYNEGVKALSAENAAKLVTLMHQWSSGGIAGKKERRKLIEAAEKTDGSIESLAKLLDANSAAEVDQEKLHNLIVRRSIYGDICQNETESDLERILKICGNDVLMANEVMKLRADIGGHRSVIPPAFYENGIKMYAPPSREINDEV